MNIYTQLKYKTIQTSRIKQRLRTNLLISWFRTVMNNSKQITNNYIQELPNTVSNSTSW